MSDYKLVEWWRNAAQEIAAMSDAERTPDTIARVILHYAPNVEIRGPRFRSDEEDVGLAMTQKDWEVQIDVLGKRYEFNGVPSITVRQR